MTECEELAESLIPKFYEWNSSKPYVNQGLSTTKIKQWIMEQLRATESYVVIDNVTEYMINKLMPIIKEHHAYITT